MVKKILPKIAIRIAISSFLSLAWCLANQGEVSPNAPLVFCGAVCLAGAWFSYLKADGLLKFGNYGKYLRRRRAEQAEFTQEPDVQPDGRESKEATPRLGVIANISAGLILIAASFLFPGIRF